MIGRSAAIVPVPRCWLRLCGNQVGGSRVLVTSLLISMPVWTLCNTNALAVNMAVGPGASIEAAAQKLQPGDTLTLRSGDYYQSVTLSGLQGTERAPIVIRGEAGAVIHAAGREGLLFWGQPSSHVVLENLTVKGAKRAGLIVSGSSHITIRTCRIADNGSWGIQTSLSDHVAVEDCDISGSREEHGIYFSTTDFPAVRNCRIYDNAACGVHLNGDSHEGGDGMITGAWIEGNTIFANGTRGGAAINMDGVEGSVIQNNLVYGNAAGGIVSFVQNGARCGENNRFIRNTVLFARGKGRFGLRLCGPSRGHVVLGNVLVCGKGAALSVEGDAAESLVSEENILFAYENGCVEYGGERMGLNAWRKQANRDQRSLCLWPAFADPEADDYRLRGTFVRKIGFRAGVSLGAGEKGEQRAQRQREPRREHRDLSPRR
jgi:hypothetical protein